MDLKSVAKDVLQESMPSLPDDQGNVGGHLNGSLPEAADPVSLLTVAGAQETTAVPAPEETMADETDNTTGIQVTGTDTAVIPVEKQRKPRRSKMSRESSEHSDVADDFKDGGMKRRGRKPKASETANGAQRARVKRAPKVIAKDPVEAPTEIFDEMSDLLQLEQENQ